MSAKIGQVAKLYRLTSGTRASWGSADSNGFASAAAPSNLDEITNVKDLDWNANDGTWDGSSRGGSGFHSYLMTLTDLEVSFGMIYDPADADFLALMKAKIAKSVLACAVLDGDKATSGNKGIWADWHVTTVQKHEQLTEGQTVDFVLKPSALSSVAPEYVAIA